MSDNKAPERIWLSTKTEGGWDDVWWPTAEEGDVEYVRADLASRSALNAQAAAEEIVGNHPEIDDDDDWVTQERVRIELIIAKHCGGSSDAEAMRRSFVEKVKEIRNKWVKAVDQDDAWTSWVNAANKIIIALEQVQLPTKEGE